MGLIRVAKLCSQSCPVDVASCGTCGDLLFASNMGAPRNPDWFHNIAADPHVTVEVGEETFDTGARVLTGPDRDAAWDRVVAARPFLVEHQDKAGRQIPLIAVTRP